MVDQALDCRMRALRSRDASWAPDAFGQGNGSQSGTDKMKEEPIRRNADDREIESGDMSGKDMRRIRQKAGLSIPELASLLRYRDFDGLRKMENGRKAVSGPIQLVMEMLDDGRLDPDAELGPLPVHLTESVTIDR